MAMISGIDASKPARFNVLRSFGSAIVYEFAVIPTTISFASGLLAFTR